jgi:hypothetical protein
MPMVLNESIHRSFCMNKQAVAVALYIVLAMPGAMPASAHEPAQWPAATPPPQYYSPPPAVVFPGSQFTYGAPPSVYAPPPGPYLQQAPSQVQSWPQPALRPEWSWQAGQPWNGRHEQSWRGAWSERRDGGGHPHSGRDDWRR